MKRIQESVKKFFQTPKKAALIIACAVAILTVLGVGTVFATNVAARVTSIGKEDAQNFAFADAGVDPASVMGVKTEFEHEQGQFVYEVDFLAGNTEYEYWIKASDGSVVKKQSELVDGFDADKVQADLGNTQADDAQTDAGSAQADNTQTDAGSTQTGNAQAGISLEEAKNKAFADAGVSASQATCTKSELTYEDGVQVYEIEFYTSDTEYDYEIKADNGDVYKKSFESFQTGKNQNAGSYIGVDKAKAIAVKHAGFQTSDVTFSKAKLENDDGSTEYEIEFYKGTTEYEYKIQAVTGDILEYDHDSMLD